jgi:hypothetical protein
MWEEESQATETPPVFFFHNYENSTRIIGIIINYCDVLWIYKLSVWIPNTTAFHEYT